MQGKELRMYRLKRDKEKIGPVLVQAAVSLWSASLQRVVTLAGAACAYGVHNKCPSVSSVPVSSVCPRPHDVITLPLPRFWFPAHSSSAFVDVISLCQLLMTRFAVY